MIVLPIVWLVLGVGAGIAVIGFVNDDDSATSTADVSTKGPTKKADKKAKKSASPSAEPTSEPTTEPTATRSVAVSVYNQVGIAGLARRVAGEAQAAGWTIGAVADWRGSVPNDTVYFPPGQEVEAEQLGRDISISRIMASVEGMSTSNLTVVLADPR